MGRGREIKYLYIRTIHRQYRNNKLNVQRLKLFQGSVVYKLPRINKTNDPESKKGKH